MKKAEPKKKPDAKAEPKKAAERKPKKTESKKAKNYAEGSKLSALNEESKAQKEQRIEAWLKDDKLKQIQEWLSNGISEAQLAHNMGISRQTLWKWKADNEALAETITEGKAVADTEVVNALYRKTQGYHYTETKERINSETGELEVVERNTKYLPPDTAAITFWLKNRQPEEWKDKVEEPEDASKHEITITFGGTPEEQELAKAYGV